MLDRSKLTVLGIVALALIGLLVRWIYFNEQRWSDELRSIDCASTYPTVFELQGKNVPVDRAATCDLTRMIAGMQPTEIAYHNDPADPWHYFGRIRITPKNDVWFVIFLTRRSLGFHPYFSLHHRKGGGWNIIGQFEADSLLRRLGVDDDIDQSLLRSDSSLVPTDELKPM